MLPNQTSATAATSATTPSTSTAPPIPTRRQLTNQPSPAPRTTPTPTVTGEDSQTHSAPSSPTHDLPVPPPRNQGQRQSSPSNRPKSMAVTNYAQIRLDDGSQHPCPRPRLTVKYAQVIKGDRKITLEQHSDGGSSAGESAENAPEATYDVPPATMSARVVNPLADLPSMDVFNNDLLPPLPPKDPMSTDPFLQGSDVCPVPMDPSHDPFAGFEVAFPIDEPHGWADDSKSRNQATVSPSQAAVAKQDEPGRSIYRDNFDSERRDTEDSLDVTGSAYNDADELLAIQRRRAEELEAERMIAEKLFAEGEALIGMESHTGNRKPAEVDRGLSPEYDLPPNEVEPHSTADTSWNGVSSVSSPYDFPAALGLHPRADENRPPSAEQPAYDAPPSELIRRQQQLHKDHSRDDRDDDSKNRPLPPLPKPNQELPPLPSHHSSETQPPFRPVGRTSSMDPSMLGNAPPLPPPNPMRVHSQTAAELRSRNTTWANGPPAPEPVPRNPPPRSSPVPSNPSPTPSSMAGQTSMPPSGPRRHHDRENMVMDLVKQGYSRTDVVKAMAISQNNPELARLILEGFGNKS